LITAGYPSPLNLFADGETYVYWGIAISSSSASPPSIIQLGGVVRSFAALTKVYESRCD
jgi:hypothetical protein